MNFFNKNSKEKFSIKSLYKKYSSLVKTEVINSVDEALILEEFHKTFPNFTASNLTSFEKKPIKLVFTETEKYLRVNFAKNPIEALIIWHVTQIRELNKITKGQELLLRDFCNIIANV